MIKYINAITAWGLQVSELGRLYGEPNMTLVITRKFAKTEGALVKDGNTKTAPMFFVLKNGKVAKLEEFLRTRYPSHTQTTAAVMKNIRDQLSEKVEQPIIEDTHPDIIAPASQSVIDDTPLKQDSPLPIAPAPDEMEITIASLEKEIDAAVNKLQQQAVIEEVDTDNTTPDVVEAPKKPVLMRKSEIRQAEKRKKRFERYRSDKTFEQEYEWVPTLFNVGYYITAPLVAAFGVLFFYSQLHSLLTLAVVAFVFLFAEVVLRRIIVRKLVAALMRGRYAFAVITFVMAAAFTTWSCMAIWNGSERLVQNGTIKEPPQQAAILALSDTLTMLRAKHAALEGKWGVARDISKDISKRIGATEKEIAELKLLQQQQKTTGIGYWRYFLLMLEAIALFCLVMPVWYEVRCVLLEEEQMLCEYV